MAVDIRLLAATNRLLEEAVEEGRFRKDLYYRLGGMVLEIPPLRERIEEIEPLAGLFVRKATQRLGWPTPPAIAPSALQLLSHYHWPGNVRELRNVLERELILSGGSRIGLDAMPAPDEPAGESTWSVDFPPRPSMNDAVEDLWTLFLEEALPRSGGNKKRAAELLGISRFTLMRQMKKLDMDERDRT